MSWENGTSCVVHDFSGKNPCCESCKNFWHSNRSSSRIHFSNNLEIMLVRDIGL